MPKRRSFLQTSIAWASLASYSRGSEPGGLLGQGDWRYRLVPGWGILGEDTPVANCHGIVSDREGHIILLTTHTKNNVIIYDAAGKLLHKWGTSFPGAHGLSIVTEGERQVLYITDVATHRVVKATLGGEILQEWRWPETAGKYAKETEYKPSWTLHFDDGEFYILDGYGKDYIQRVGADGKVREIFGGQEGGIAHWGPHGGMAEMREGRKTLLVAMSDQQYLLALDEHGKKLQQVDMPGGNPRQIRKHGNHYFVAHLADNWPADRQSRGFVSVLDENFKVVSNISGTSPIYDDKGILQKMAHSADTFMHPHDLVVGADESLYVAQFASGNTYPLKLERV